MNAQDHAELLETFLDEATAGLDSVRRILSSLAQSSDLEGELFTAYRAMHSLAGNASLFGFEALFRLAQRLEVTLDELRHGRTAPDPRLISRLQEALPALSSLLQHAAESEGASVEEEESAAQTEALVEELESLTSLFTIDPKTNELDERRAGDQHR